ncbi:MAG: hypothetical protein HYR51_11685 [Candidatus Rokubacteria bacterium]|nr:hypothetical protein [Candidatus Rokubacteria bacterium]
MGNGRIRALALSAIVIAAPLSFATPGEGKPDPERMESPAALPAAVASERDCDNPLMPAADVEGTPKRLIGQVTSLDHNGGLLILATRSGAVSLHASAETLSELGVGDVIVLELTPEPDALATRGDCP